MRLYIILIIFLNLILLISCNNTSGVNEIDNDDGVLKPITFNGAGLESLEISRALSDFPNSDIGVVAALYNGGAVTWTSYSDIYNARAVPSSEVGGTFFFKFSPVKYWPFDDTELVFLAYSPVANNSSVTLESSGTELSLQLQENMPDVMYASTNTTAATTPYKKTDRDTVDLVEFRHALSKITVEVKPDDVMNPNIRLVGLEVETQYRNATLDLLQGDNGFNLSTPTPFTYNLGPNNVNFSSTPYTKDIFLYPGTESNTRVYIKLTDGVFEFENWYTISQFDNMTTTGQDLEFVMGYTTVLTFTVRSTPVQNPNDFINLQGRLTDWLDQGELEVIIQ